LGNHIFGWGGIANVRGMIKGWKIYDGYTSRRGNCGAAAPDSLSTGGKLQLLSREMSSLMFSGHKWLSLNKCWPRMPPLKYPPQHGERCSPFCRERRICSGERARDHAHLLSQAIDSDESNFLSSGTDGRGCRCPGLKADLRMFLSALWSRAYSR
jgi:hypothetical protein